MSEIERTPAYSIITQDSAPKFFKQFFECIESRYVRRSAYIDHFSQMFLELTRLGMSNAYEPYIDSAGNIVYRVPEEEP